MNYLAKTKKPTQPVDSTNNKTPHPIEELFNTTDTFEGEKSLFYNQYKLYVEMADRVSARRATTNSFFLTANSFLFVAMGALFSNSSLFIFIPIILVVGIFFCVSWTLLILYYKGLNSCKYQVINEIEERLPIKGFVTEWKLSKIKDSTQRFRSLTNIEKWIPLSLIILYSIAMVLVIVYIALNPELIFVLPVEETTTTLVQFIVQAIFR